MNVESGVVEMPRRKLQLSHGEKFAQFWNSYPRKVGKLDAEKAFRQALRISSATDIVAGVEQYLQQVLKSRTELQFIPYPATWLRAGRWMDTYSMTMTTTGATSPTPRTSWLCPHEPPCSGRSICATVQSRQCPHEPKCDDRPSCIDRLVEAMG